MRGGSSLDAVKARFLKVAEYSQRLAGVRPDDPKFTKSWRGVRPSWTPEQKDHAWHMCIGVPGKDRDQLRIDLGGNLIFREVKHDGSFSYRMEVDHIRPFSFGGGEAGWNTAGISKKSNTIRGNKSLVKFVLTQEQTCYST